MLLTIPLVLSMRPLFAGAGQFHSADVMKLIRARGDLV